MIYKQIFDFKQRRAEKLYNSSYLEELTGLIEKAASCIDSGKHYYFDSNYYLEQTNNEPNSSYREFINSFKNTFTFSSSDKVNIIRGRAGIGKTLFFNQGVQILLRDKSEHKDKYIELGVNFKNIDAKKDVEYYTEYIYEKLNHNAIDAIRQLGSVEYKLFEKMNNEYCGTQKDTPFAKLYPVGYFCKAIYNKYKKPCIIILDNIDLACVLTQRNVFRATAKVCEVLNKFMDTQNAREIYRMYFAMRPETCLRSNEMRIGEVINFPLPDIQAICLETIKKVLIETATTFDEEKNLKCGVTYYNIITNEMVEAKTFLDVANYFNEIFTHYLNDLWNESDCIVRLGTNQDFHCNIANYNVRSFLNFLADTLSNGGFKPLTKEFNENLYGGYYNVFDYIEMIIRGRWMVHPGNKYIDGEGGNKAPIVFNIFDTSLWQKNKIKHFMLYIRILQYFDKLGNDESLCYGDIKKILVHFFDEENIKKAIQELTFIKFLYSFFEGDENIESKSDYREVVIEDNTALSLSPSGKFYIEKLICEFEYLYQMALSSLMPSNYVEELKDCWQSEKERTVLYFLNGIFDILKENIENYDDEALKTYEEEYCQCDENCCSPYRRMVSSFVTVMKKKVQRAEKMEIKSLEKLREILKEAELLQTEIEDFFAERIGD